MNLSFSSCGFLWVYHFGVLGAIREFAPKLIMNKVSGASGGSIIAALLLCDIDFGQVASEMINVLIQTRSTMLSTFDPSFDLMRLVDESLRTILPSDAHKICTGRLNISLTRFPDGKNIIVSEFESKEELIQRYIDGGVSDGQPGTDTSTVTVSPYAGKADICPLDWECGSYFGLDFANLSIQFSCRNLYRIIRALLPPDPKVYLQIFHQGFEDALRFLANNDLLSCARCVSLRPFMTLSDKAPISELSLAVHTVSACTSLCFCQKSKNQHHEFECESCQDKKIAFVARMQKSFDAAEALEKHSLLGYMFSIRPLRYLCYLVVPWLFLFKVVLSACKSLLSLAAKVKDVQWFFDRPPLTSAILQIDDIYTAQDGNCQPYQTRESIMEGKGGADHLNGGNILG